MPDLLDAFRARLRGFLTDVDDLDRSDLIFVLAGRRDRKVHGARLFGDGWAPRLVMSTTNPQYIARVLTREVPEDVLPSDRTRSTLRELASQPYPERSERKLSLACLDEEGWSVLPTSPTPFGTLTEMKALSAWLQEHPAVRSVLLVSEGIHLKRLRLCCRRMVPPDRSVRLVAAPMESGDDTALGGPPPTEGIRDMVVESCKYLLYSVLLILE
jgi:hypothetical protein